MSLTLSPISAFEKIKLPLRTLSDVAGFSVCDSRGARLISGYNTWKKAECSQLALSTLFRSAQTRDLRRVRPPFHAIDDTVRVYSIPKSSGTPGPYWFIEDAKGGAIWGGWRSEEDALVGLTIVETIYAAGVAAADASPRPLRLVGAAA